MDEIQEASSSSASTSAMHEEPDESYVDEEEEEDEGSLDEGGDGRGKAPVVLSKEQAQSNIDSELLKMQQARAVQAERKLQYLLKQSDIFQHFGVDAGKADDRPNKKGPAKKRMSEKEGDSEALKSTDDKGGTRLLKQPSVIQGAMRPYQLEGLNWLIRNHENGINGILADEMGLGKTLQSISILAYLHEFEEVKGPHLILVPKSTMYNWMKELERFCPVLRPVCFHGAKDERAAMVEQVLCPGQAEEDRQWDVIVTTYEVANNERNALQKFAWKYLIIDEAHRIKNENARFSQTVRLLHTQERLLITGTPLQNNLHELWALLNFLLPDIFSDSEQFDEWFNLEVDDREAKQRMIGQLHKLLRPFMLRRLKADVEKSLPPKTETILYIGMSEMQKRLYKDLLTRNRDLVIGKTPAGATAAASGGAGGGHGGGNRTAILNIVMQLRKCCNHPYLFQGAEDRNLDPHGSHLVDNCGKLVLLDKLLTRLYAKGHRVLIFSQMTRMLDILDDYLVSKGYQYCRIDGKTSYEERSDLIDAYNAENSSKFVFLLSTRAGGLGINLQTADTVVLFDSDWNPQADLQAQDRAHRIGQKKAVHVYRLVTENSIEEKVVERATQKLKLDAMVVQSGRLQENQKKLSKDDMLQAVKFGADAVFRSSESSISNEDIDTLIERGQKKTASMLQELKDKGDAYDFSFTFDGNFNTQEFQGVDYSDPKARQQAIDAQLVALMSEDDLRGAEDKRARKPVANYNEDAYFRAQQAAGFNADGSVNNFADRRVKVPKHMRLPKMEDWQFYDVAKLHELCATEEALYGARKAAKDLPAHGINKLQVLDDESQALKDKLLREGRGDWGRAHYAAFVKSSAKHGRWDYARIAADVGKDPAEVKSYAELFWRVAPHKLPPAEYESVLRRVEKGEKKLGDIERLSKATRDFLARWPQPLEQLCFRFVGTHGHVFGPDEDRRLLVYTNTWGYGNWARIRAEVRACDLFRFDYYLRSLSAADLAKRCETLMREAAKELAELEKRSSAQDDLKQRLHAEVVAALPALCLGDVNVNGTADAATASPPAAGAASEAATGGAAANTADSGAGGAGAADSGAADSAMEVDASGDTPAPGANDRSSSGENGNSAAHPSAPSGSEASAAAIADARARLYVEFAARQETERLERESAEAAAAQQRALAMQQQQQQSSEDGGSSGATGCSSSASTGASGGGGGAGSPKLTAPTAAQRPTTSSESGGGGDEEDVMGRDSGRFLMRPVTAEQLPALLHVVYTLKLDAREKIVLEFLKTHPQVSKRQVEAKLAEIALKERRGTERAWWLKPEYEAQYFAQRPESAPAAGSASAGTADADASSSSSSNGASSESQAELSTDAASSSSSSSTSSTVAAGPTGELPRPAHSAKALFRKHHLPDVKQALGPSASKMAFKAELDRMWEAASATERAKFDALAQADEERYQRELAASREAGAVGGGGGGQKRTAPSPTAGTSGDDRASPSSLGLSQIPKKKKA